MSASATIERWAERFDAFQQRASDADHSDGSGGSEWLSALRRDAFDHFRDQGFPSRRLEAWKYTNVDRIASTDFELPAAGDAMPSRERVEELSVPLFACSLFVFVNGTFAPALSTSRAVSGDLHVESLAALRGNDLESLRGSLAQQVDTKIHGFAALNTCFLDDGAVIRLPRGQAAVQPIHLVFLTTGRGDTPLATHPRVLIDAEEGSHAVIIQDHVSVGEETRLTNAVTEIKLGANASVDLILLQRECDAAFHISNTAAQLGRDSRLSIHTLSLGGALVRNDLAVVLGDTGAECKLNGLFLGTGTRLVDNHTLVDHAVPNTTSTELYKGVLSGNSRGIFRGRVIVRPNAQKTNAQQSNPNLILSDKAEVDSRPQLEIYADDVKCNHGTSIGQLDEEALFYLRSRGIGPAEAFMLLTQGFANEITKALPAPAVGEHVRELLLTQLHRDASASRGEAA